MRSYLTFRSILKPFQLKKKVSWIVAHDFGNTVTKTGEILLFKEAV